MRQTRSAISIFFTLVILIVAFGEKAHAGIALGAYGSWGSLKDSNQAIPPVKESTIGAYLLPSYEFFPMLSMGLYGEYDRVGQLTSYTNASGYNKGYEGYLAGGALVFSGSLFQLSGAYTFLGKGTLNKKTSSGLTTTLENPKGLHIILSVSVLPAFSLDFGYTTVKYEVFVGGVTSYRTRSIYDYRLGGSIHL
jgi:hypothetical protein